MLAHAPYLHTLRLKFVSKGHRVKVKVTGAKKVENSYPRNRSAITPVLSNIQPDVCMQHGVFWYGGSNGVTAIFVT